MLFLAQSSQDFQLVYQKLESALKQVNALKAENQAIREAKELRPDNRIGKLTNASRRQNAGNVEPELEREEQRHPVLPKPIDPRTSSTNLYSKNHEVEIFD